MSTPAPSSRRSSENGKVRRLRPQVAQLEGAHRLTFNYGLRWEIYFPQYVNGKDRGATVSLSTGEVLIAGENGVSSMRFSCTLKWTG